MDYRTAYENVSKSLWKYAQEQEDAYVRLMLEIRRIENTIGTTLPPIHFIPPEHEQ